MHCKKEIDILKAGMGSLFGKTAGLLIFERIETAYCGGLDEGLQIQTIGDTKLLHKRESLLILVKEMFAV